MYAGGLFKPVHLCMLFFFVWLNEWKTLLCLLPNSVMVFMRHINKKGFFTYVLWLLMGINKLKVNIKHIL